MASHTVILSINLEMETQTFNINKHFWSFLKESAHDYCHFQVLL